MRTKYASTRFSIVKRSKGQSAVDAASYISRSVLVSEYDGKTYRPKYHEDLVHCEINLPEYAPEEWLDRAVLWNSVELNEKQKNAQLCRTLKAALPNDWSYELAEETVRDYVQRNFVSKGMCADWAIHDSVNQNGIHNLHFHLMLTLRPVEENGKWGAKQRKEYILDKDGNKIRNKSGRGFKSRAVDVNDWNEKGNSRKWRKDLTDTINVVNDRIGLPEYWEHRSFKELGLEQEPTRHLGPIASALERKGIRTEKGDANRAIMPELEPDELAYKIDDRYFAIQRTEEGYDYTFYALDYDEIDGGAYDNPDISMQQAMEDILEDEEMSLENAVPVDYEDLMAEVEEAGERQMQLAQLLKNCPPSIFEDYDRKRAVDTCEGIVMQFTKSKGYLTVQATEEGYFYIFYDSDLHEIHSNDYDDPKVSVQKATYEILKSERMDDMECVKVDYKEFEAMTIQHSKDLLQSGELRATSEIGRDEAALNGLSRAEVERGVLYHAQGILEDMGLENEVELLAARVHGSRSREELYRDDSDLDVVLSYRGNIREDSFFNELNAHGIAMAGIKVDINPIAEERITLAEYMKESEAYLDQKEIEKLAVDLDNFSYEYDTYEYKDIVENREEQVKKITEDILNKKTGCLKDWLVEVSEESDIDSDVITARSLLSRLENAETFSIFTRQSEQEQPEATISFYVAECMEFPVMGEYHNNLTLEEAIKIYESIPAERLHGIKGIGFDLQDGDEDYSGEYGLMSGDRIDRDLIDMIPHYKESPLVSSFGKDC